MDFLETVKKRCPNFKAAMEIPPPTLAEIAAKRAKREAEQRRETECKRKAAEQKFLKSRGRRYCDCCLNSFKAMDPQRQVQLDAVKRLRAFCVDMPEITCQGGGVVLFGPKGTGKDHLLVALARIAIRENGLDVHWESGMEIFADFRAAIGNDTPERTLIDRMVKPQILILSDPLPPKGDLTDWQAMTLYRIIDARYCECRPTWVSINVANGTEAENRMGAATYDRLRDGALGVFCDWPSYRKAR